MLPHTWHDKQLWHGKAIAILHLLRLGEPCQLRLEPRQGHLAAKVLHIRAQAERIDPPVAAERAHQ